MTDDLSPRDEMRQRATQAMLTDAFFRWESAVTIALTMLLAFFLPTLPAPFEWWQWWFWIIGGGIAEAALIITHMTDPRSAQLAVARLFTQQYDPREIKNRLARERMLKALEYRSGIAGLMNEQSGAMRVSFEETLSEIDNWIENIYRLARRMDVFEGDAILERDRRSVPQELAALRRRMELEKGDTVRHELQEAIQLKQQQYSNLMKVADNMKRADIQLDNTLAALGTLYAQMQVIDTKDLDSARARRLRDEIHDEVAELEDTIIAMDEVYSSSSRLAE
jgi:hypothetical protein